MIVVDVGCMTYGGDESVHKLIDRFHPEVLFGFDPWPWMEEGVERVADTVVVRRRAAACSRAGIIAVKIDGLRTGIETDEEQARHEAAFIADAFDFPGWIRALPPTDTVLKLDAEGAEYPLLTQIRESDLDERLALVLVEWHPRGTSHGMFMEERPALRCPVEEWA